MFGLIPSRQNEQFQQQIPPCFRRLGDEFCSTFFETVEDYYASLPRILVCFVVWTFPIPKSVTYSLLQTVISTMLVFAGKDVNNNVGRVMKR